MNLSSAALTALFATTVTFIVVFILLSLKGDTMKDEPSKSLEPILESPSKKTNYARSWFIYGLVLGTIAKLPSVFIHQNANALVGWIALSIMLGLLGLVLGWLYGLFK